MNVIILQKLFLARNEHKYTGLSYLLKIPVLKFARRNRMLKVNCTDEADRQEMEILSSGIYIAYEIAI